MYPLVSIILFRKYSRNAPQVVLGKIMTQSFLYSVILLPHDLLPPQSVAKSLRLPSGRQR